MKRLYKISILADATEADLTINLPAASSAREGLVISIKKADNTTNKIIITTDASETIDVSSYFPSQVEGE